MNKRIVQVVASAFVCVSQLAWPAPDLTVTDIELVPALPAVSTGLLRATITNIGPDGTDLPVLANIGVEFYRNGVICDAATILENLDASESVISESGACNPDVADTYDITVVVDTEFEVAESNEANNSRTEPFEWAETAPVVIFDTDLALPAMPGGDGSGTPVCVDEASGLLVAGCDVTVTADQIDPTSVQRRVDGVCAAGYSIREINLNGSVVCEPDADTVLSEVEVDAFVANNNYSTGPHTIDTTLSEGEVDAFVANNNYSTGPHTVDTICSLGDCVEPGRATLSCGTSSVTVNCVGWGGDVWIARSAAETNAWQSITYGDGLYVAVANDGTNRVLTSSDGIAWTVRAAAVNSGWTSVTYGGGLFVAVANTGTNRVMTSPDGITWTARDAAEASNWISVTYGKGLFVAVANLGTNRVMTSPDGITWTIQSAAEANSWYSVTYGNELFVAIALDGTHRVMTSPDGIAWTARDAAYESAWASVTYGNGLFVAVSYASSWIMTSPDGITWTGHNEAEPNAWYSVAYGGGLFVAVAASGTDRVMTSTDGVNWTAHSAAEASFWTSVTHGDGLFVAVAFSGTYRIMTSPGG
jgi:hypothetical protein